MKLINSWKFGTQPSFFNAQVMEQRHYIEIIYHKNEGEPTGSASCYSNNIFLKQQDPFPILNPKNANDI